MPQRQWVSLSELLSTGGMSYYHTVYLICQDILVLFDVYFPTCDLRLELYSILIDSSIQFAFYFCKKLLGDINTSMLWNTLRATKRMESQKKIHEMNIVK